MATGYEITFDKIEILKWTMLLNLITIVTLIIYFNKNPKQFLRIIAKCIRYYAGFTERQIQPNGCAHPITYIERGVPSKIRPSILFVHGFSSQKDHIVQISLNIPSKYHIVALDLPGHGESPIDEGDLEGVGIQYYTQTLKAFSDAIGLSQRKYHLMGESMGGGIVGYHSSIYPQDIATLSMICPLGVSFDGWKEMKEGFRKTGEHILLACTFEEIKELAKIATHKPLPFPNIVLRALLQIRQERRVFHRKLFEVLITEPNDILLEQRLEHIEVPSMLLWGEKDAILHVSSVDIIKSKMSTLKKCIRFSNTGHTLSLECPKKVAQHFVEFINMH